MENQELSLNLESFQGPFDLLLHLIKQMEVDLYDIPMAEVTHQYLSYIQSMKEIQLDIIGDYLVMAATLMEIKSRMLLPIEPDPEIDSDYESVDPRDNLIQQLLLYQQFQTVATQLELKQESRAKLYNRPMTDLTEFYDVIPLEEGILNIQNLANAMENVLEKYLMRQPQEKNIHQDHITIAGQIEYINSAFHQLDKGEKLIFNDLIITQSASEIVTTFLAMLELVKNHTLTFKQIDKDAVIEMELIN